jgi:hypothetical protein
VRGSLRVQDSTRVSKITPAKWTRIVWLAMWKLQPSLIKNLGETFCRMAHEVLSAEALEKKRKLKDPIGKKKKTVVCWKINRTYY